MSQQTSSTASTWRTFIGFTAALIGYLSIGAAVSAFLLLGGR